jgi:competence protein ComEC
VGGCGPVLRTLRVGWIADSGQEYGGPAYRDCIATAHALGVPIRYPHAGDVWQIDPETRITFLSPAVGERIEGDDEINENSIVFMLTYRNWRGLFMGDAGMATEERLLRSGMDLHADLLKVGHHGSAYASSPAFLAAVRPRFAVISVGRHNLFGHPAPRALAALAAAGAAIYRTDRCGAVTVKEGGISAMLPCGWRSPGSSQ